MTAQLKRSLQQLNLGELEAELARRHLADFVRYTKKDYQFNWHHETICNAVDKFARGEIKKLLIFAPPQHGKSELTTRRLPAYLLGKNPALKIAIVSYAKDLAMGFNRDIQRIIDDHSYKAIFPNTVLNRSNVVTNVKSGYLRNNTMFETVPYKGSVRTVGVEGTLTGFPVDIAIFDDLYKSRDDAMSKKRQSTVRSFYDSVLIPRLHNDSQILGTFTRWSEDDIAGYLLSVDTDWTVIVLPAIKEKEMPGDPRKIGEALWPEKHSLERLLDIKKKNIIVFNSLYQQKPKAPDEILIYKYNEIAAMPTHLSFRYGVDFGYQNDPTVVLQMCWEKKGSKMNIYLNEILYKTKMTNGPIIQHLKDRKIPLSAPYYCDRDPKDIDELKLLGLNAIPADKGKGSVLSGINTMQDAVHVMDDRGEKIKSTHLYITSHSHNVKRDFDNYQWEVFNGKPINVPVEGNDHACFVGSTPVLTENGNVRIDSVREGDRVLTSKGYRKVLHKWNNGYRLTKLFRLQFDTFSLSLRCTPEHKVKMGDTWVEISKLVLGQTVSLTNISGIENISYNQEKDISNAIDGTCMSMCGNIIMVNDLKDTTFITGTKTPGTIGSPIYSVKNQHPIYQNIPSNDTKTIRSLLNCSTSKVLKQQRSGTVASRVGNGIENTQSKVGKVGHTSQRNVRCVAKDIKPDTSGFQSTAIRTARLLRLDVGEERMEKVYDLLVEDMHEYFANGLLVHNCDAMRYCYITSTRGIQSPGSASAY